MAIQDYEWDTTSLYASADDPKLDRDVKKIERAYAAFAKRYRGSRTWLKKPQALKQALEEYEALSTLPKPLAYLFLKKSIHTDDKKIDARIAQVQAILVRATNKVQFFTLWLAQIPKEDQKTLLASDELSDFVYFLKRIFAWSKHDLSENEETLLNALDLPREDMWVDLTERLVNASTVDFDNRTLPLSEAMNKISTLPTQKRRSLHKTVMETLAEHADVAEAELNALYTGKRITDDRRGFRDPVEETLLDFETSKKELNALRDAVHDSRRVSHDFYRHKKKLLGLSKLTYADRNTDPGKMSRSFSFETSVDLLRDVFHEAHPAFRDVLGDMLAGHRIDVFPRQHKTSGAFCFGTVAFPTYVMLNHISTFDALTTFAHEMGHAIHTELSKRERPLYQGYSTAVAEFASTFFEDMIFDAIRPTLSPAEAKIALHNRINRDISSVFRQIAFFDFEYDLHNAVREHGYVPKEEIAQMLNQHTGAYLGDAVELDDRDGYFFVALSHIRRYFYVYSYAYGGLLSRVAARRAREDSRVFDGVVELLSSGGTDSPKKLFKKIGLHTEKKETFEEGVAAIKKDLEALKRL